MIESGHLRLPSRWIFRLDSVLQKPLLLPERCAGAWTFLALFAHPFTRALPSTQRS